jgi:ketosteroid isomerase-like protein
VNASGRDEAGHVVDELLHDLVAAQRAFDLDAVLDLFSSDPVLFGSADGEVAVGREALRSFYEELFRASATYGWTWDEPIAGRHRDVIWFVAPAVLHVVHDGGDQRDVPYRLSGVLRLDTDNHWRLALFNGSEPATAAGSTSGGPEGSAGSSA